MATSAIERDTARDLSVARIKVARLHEVGAPMVIEAIEVPALRPTDVRVEVRACNIVPNLHNILANWATWFPDLPLPRLPAVFGLDSAGIVTEVGARVEYVFPGDRVYVNPGLSCGSCPQCRRGEPAACRNYVFMGYFGFGPDAQRVFDAYPLAGLGESLIAPQANLIHLPAAVSFEEGSRLGYLGTAFSGLKKGRVGAHTDLLILGATGTLGLGAVLVALALGVRRIIGTARNREIMEAVRALAPDRIEMLSLDEGPVAPRVREMTGGAGVEVVLSCLGPGAPPANITDALGAVARGGRLVNVSGVSGLVPTDYFRLMCAGIDVLGGCWFTPGEGQELADLAGSGVLDLSPFEHRRYPLEQVNELLGAIPNRRGGFTNFVVMPNGF